MGRPSRTRLTPVLDELVCDIACRIVIGVQFFPALLTAELVAVAVLIVGKPTLCVGTPLAGVRRIHRLNGDSSRFGLVRDLPYQFVERPLLEL